MFVHKRSVCKEQWELVLLFTKLDISIWCGCFLSIFDFESDSRPLFRSESVQRFIYFNKIGYFFHKRSVCKEQWELVLTFTKLDISIWCEFDSILDLFFEFSILIRILDLISDPNQSRDSYILIKLDTFSIRECFVCKEQWELVLTFTKLDISIWCFLSIFVLIRILVFSIEIHIFW